MLRIKTLLLITCLFGLFTLSVPAYAQDTTLTVRQADPISLIVMVVGLAGLLLIGILTISGGNKDNGK